MLYEVIRNASGVSNQEFSDVIFTGTLEECEDILFLKYREDIYTLRPVEDEDEDADEDDKGRRKRRRRR
jgi:hypothetical protein